MTYNVREDLLKTKSRAFANLSVEEMDAIDAEIINVVADHSIKLSEMLAEQVTFLPTFTVSRAIAWGYLAGRMAAWKYSQNAINSLSLVNTQLCDMVRELHRNLDPKGAQYKNLANQLTQLLQDIESLDSYIPYEEPEESSPNNEGLQTIVDTLKANGFDVTVEVVTPGEEKCTPLP